MNYNFDSVYEEFYPAIVRYVTRMTGTAEAEDITQEVFIKVNRSLEGFKGESSLATWIYRIATNTTLDSIKASSRKPTNPLTEADLEAMDNDESRPYADEEIVREDMNECIREFIDRLPPDYRAVLLLGKFGGLKNNEIAEVLGISVQTVKIRLHRGQARLRDELNKGCDLYHDSKRGLSCDRKSPDAKAPIPIKFRKSG